MKKIGADGTAVGINWGKPRPTNLQLGWKCFRRTGLVAGDAESVCRIMVQIVRHHLLSPTPDKCAAVALDMLEAVGRFALVVDDNALRSQPAAGFVVAGV